MSALLTSPYRHTADQLIEHTRNSAGSINARLERLTELEFSLGQLVLEDWQEDEATLPQGLHAASTLACAPAMQSMIQGAVTRDTAVEVNNNLALLAELVTNKRPFDKAQPNLNGKLSEFAVLALMWWGFSSGYSAPNSYALPASSQQDSSRGGGLRNGIDIIARVDGKKFGVQVKSSKHKAKGIYAAGIKLVSPKQLVGERRATEVIIKDIVGRKHRELSDYYDNLESILSVSKVRKKQFDQKVYRQLKEVK